MDVDAFFFGFCWRGGSKIATKQRKKHEAATSTKRWIMRRFFERDDDSNLLRWTKQQGNLLERKRQEIHQHSTSPYFLKREGERARSHRNVGLLRCVGILSPPRLITRTMTATWKKRSPE
jgi:hypothetical protein